MIFLIFQVCESATTLTPNLSFSQKASFSIGVFAFYDFSKRWVFFASFLQRKIFETEMGNGKRRPWRPRKAIGDIDGTSSGLIRGGRRLPISIKDA